MRFLIAIFLTFFISAVSYANDGIEIFFSNNTNVIDIEQAYNRLIGEPQRELKNTAINILQQNHVEQGKFNNILGTYQMSDDKKVTGDNTEIFHTSPLQTFTKEQVFAIAKQFANQLNQESVAVFIPSSKPVIGNITVSFPSHQPSITEMVALMQKQLPAAYNQAFSLHLSNQYSGFQKAKVSSVEWLGRNYNVDELSKAFPTATISYRYGDAYLVYKTGQVELL